MSSRESSEKDLCPIDPSEIIKVKVNPDGTVTRFELPTVPPTTVDDILSSDKICSKDVTINENTKTWMRIYIPKTLSSSDKNVAKLPLILNFHPGLFITFHADTMTINEQCARYASELSTIVASVNYRLAPEHRLPAAYEDAMDALVWIKNQALDPNGDPWLRNFVDFSQVILMGTNSGANIAYRLALQAQEVDLDTIRISGIILNQPFFGGTKETKSEIRGKNDNILPLSLIDYCFSLALPLGSDKDHEYSNPCVEGKYSKYIGSLPRVLIWGFEGDPLLDRHMKFAEMLIMHRVQVTAHFGEIGFHLVDVFVAKWHLVTMKYISDFI